MSCEHYNSSNPQQKLTSGTSEMSQGDRNTVIKDCILYILQRTTWQWLMYNLLGHLIWPTFTNAAYFINVVVMCELEQSRNIAKGDAAICQGHTNKIPSNVQGRPKSDQKSEQWKVRWLHFMIHCPAIAKTIANKMDSVIHSEWREDTSVGAQPNIYLHTGIQYADSNSLG